MNDKVLRQVEEMKKQTIGVDVEMTEPLPAKAGRFKLLLKQPEVISAQGYRFYSPRLFYFRNGILW